MSGAWTHQYVEVDGTRAHYLEAGSGEDTLLLLHGGGTSSCAELNYGSVLGRLGAHLRVLALDIVGFGFTPGRGPQDYPARAQGDFVVAFMEKLDLISHVAGNSHGGWVAQYVAHQSPQRVKSLVIINSLNGTQPIPPAPQGDQYIFSPVGHAHEYPTRNQVTQELLAFYVNSRLVTPERVERTLEIALLNYAFSRARAQATSATIAAANDNLQYRGRHLADHAAQLAMPVLMTWSRENRGSRPEDALPFFNQLRDGEMHVFCGAGHHVMTELPQRWSSVVLEFLRAPRG